LGTDPAGRVLAVDWGQKRFGLAVSDPLRMIAQPLITLTRRAGKRAPVGKIVELIQTHEVTEVVVGLPLTPEGKEREAAREARALGEAIARRSGIPVHFADERMSTAHATKSARRAGVKDEDSREKIDQMAAVAILQGWLDRRTDA
jgi:putative Holliday junction resolvase